MNEEGDTPTAPEAVQSTPIVSHNDEIAPKMVNNMTLFQRVGSFIGRKKSKAAESDEDIVALLTKELEDCRRERDRFKIAIEYEAKLKAKEIDFLQKMEAELKSSMTRMECEIKTKSEEVDNLKRKSEDKMASSKLESDKLNEKLEANKEEFDRYKRDFDAKWTEKDIEIKLKAKEIENLKKLEVEWKSRISQLEKDVKVAKNGENLKISGGVQRILMKVEKSSNDLRNLQIQTSRDVTRGFEKVETKLRSLLDRPTEMTIRSRFSEISKLTSVSVFSQPTEFAGIFWRIELRKEENCYLGIYLEGKKSLAGKWSCAVRADFQLISQKDDSIVVQHAFENPVVYDELESAYCWGMPPFIPFTELLEGDAVMDDSIIVAVVVKVFPFN